MKKTIVLIVIIFNLFSCKKDNNCDMLTSIEKTEKLKIGDKLPGFYPLGNNKLSFLDLKKEKIAVFFKSENDNIKEGYNQEIDDIIWQELKNNNVDIIVISDLKIAGIYGIFTKENKINNNILLIADNNKIIKKIYKNICINNIANIIINN
ncbi:hypothetical protein V6251_11295 [Olleya sp. Ti.3.14]|uniref:hypothetical protein n=1 Tax=Olleya sp. Ti.3.14 TaxID=3121297 RepID=UPI00311EC403